MIGSTLLPAAYDAAPHTWQLLPTSSAAATAQPTLTVVTYNVWFGRHAFGARCAALLRLLERCDADLIALQEVTPAFLDRVLRSAWVRRAYAVSDLSGGSVDPYGVLLLSRLPIAAWGIHPLPTAMGRQLVTATTSINGAPFTFAAVHLESLSYSTPTRAKQLERIFPLLDATPNVLLMGDFNFCGTWAEEQARIDVRYGDVWPALRPSEAGFTIDTERNAMHWQQTLEKEQVRFDRVLLRSDQRQWLPKSIALLGTEPLDERKPAIFPSDHFGLLATVAWQGAEQQATG